MPNNWDKFSIDEQILFLDAANSLIGLYMVKDIVETFNKVNLPLLFNQPGFYNKFCPDIPNYIDIVEKHRINRMKGMINA